MHTKTDKNTARHVAPKRTTRKAADARKTNKNKKTARKKAIPDWSEILDSRELPADIVNFG